VAMTDVQLSESADCARCDEPLGDQRGRRTCPHCGAKKAGRCRLCGAAVYLGTDTCASHRPKESRPLADLEAASPPSATSPPQFAPPPSAYAVAPARQGWSTGKIVAVVVGAVGVVFVVLVVISIVAATFLGARARVQDRAALDSPARPLVKEPCAQYREISIRLSRDNADQAAVRDALGWVEGNRQVFAEAARLDGGVAEAAAYVVWLDDLFHDPALLARTTQDEITSREKPLTAVCTTGAGQA
jgi:predicted RNA-binding Zn-ribbon protein involved in translation (DUF1610 family)